MSPKAAAAEACRGVGTSGLSLTVTQEDDDDSLEVALDVSAAPPPPPAVPVPIQGLVRGGVAWVPVQDVTIAAVVTNPAVAIRAHNAGWTVESTLRYCNDFRLDPLAWALSLFCDERDTPWAIKANRAALRGDNLLRTFVLNLLHQHEDDWPPQKHQQVLDILGSRWTAADYFHRTYGLRDYRALGDASEGQKKEFAHWISSQAEVGVYYAHARKSVRR